MTESKITYLGIMADEAQRVVSGDLTDLDAVWGTVREEGGVPVSVVIGNEVPEAAISAIRAMMTAVNPSVQIMRDGGVSPE